MSGVEDLWERSKEEKFDIGRRDMEYYYSKPLKNIPNDKPTLYIYPHYYKKTVNYAAIQEAFLTKGTNRRMVFVDWNRDDNQAHKEISTLKDLEQFIGKINLPPSVVTHPDGSISIAKLEAGAMVYKKSAMKKHLLGRDRVIYLGKHNKQYIKVKGKYTAVSSI